MKRINAVVLAIFIVVFCLQAKTVVDVSTWTTTSYDNNGNISSITFGKQRHEYDTDGLLIRTTSYAKISDDIFNKSTVVEYDVYGNYQRVVFYNKEGEITGEEKHENTMILINFTKLIEKQKTEHYMNGILESKTTTSNEYDNYGNIVFSSLSRYDVDGNLSSRAEAKYEYSFNKDTCFVKINQYNRNETLVGTVFYEILQATINSKKLEIAFTYYISENQKLFRYENEYDSEGLLTKHTYYIWSNNNFIKTHLSNYTYTFKTINTTAASPKKEMLQKNHFQISKNSNMLYLNFADNSDKRIEIINPQGSLLKSHRFSTKTHSVNIGSLPRGVYILRIFENEKVNSVRFVKE